MVDSSRPRLVEILYFDGCPNYEDARELVVRLSAELGIKPDIRLIEVADAEAARRRSFLGSPTVRVDGHDVEPGAESRTDYVLSCRLYGADRSYSGQPDDRWLREALTRRV